MTYGFFARSHVSLYTLVLVLLTGCATPPYQYSEKHIETAARPHFSSLDTYLAVGQKEIYADIVKSQTAAVMGGGLLWAMIDGSADNESVRRAETLIQPIRDNLLDFDFAEYLRAEINRSLADIQWLNAREVVLERTTDPERYSSGFSNSDAAAVLFINADCRLSPKFDFLQTRADLIMFPKDKRLYAAKEDAAVDDEENPVEQADSIYREEVVVTKSLGTAGLDISQAAAELALPAMESDAKAGSPR